MKIDVLRDFTVGIGYGLIEAFVTPRIIEPLCRTDGKWTDYYCLRTAAFFDPARLELIIKPLAKLKDSIAWVAEKFVPDIIPIYPRMSCDHFLKTIGNLKTRAEHIPADLTASITPILKISENTYRSCCSKPSTSSSWIANAFAEELIFRYGIQKIALLAFSKLFSGKPKAILSHSVTRILITSLIFAFYHNTAFVSPQFVGGIISGAVYEATEHSLLAATIAHATSNIATDLFDHSPRCDYSMETAISSLTDLVARNTLG